MDDSIRLNMHGLVAPSKIVDGIGVQLAEMVDPTQAQIAFHHEREPLLLLTLAVSTVPECSDGGMSMLLFDGRAAATLAGQLGVLFEQLPVHVRDQVNARISQAAAEYRQYLRERDGQSQ